MKKLSFADIKVRNLDIVAVIQRKKGAHQDRRRKVKHKKDWLKDGN